MRILFIGEIVGSAGIYCVKALLPNIKRELNIDLTIAAAEGATGGFGIGKGHAVYLHKLGVDVVTAGDFAYFKRDVVSYFGEARYLLRPANYPHGNPGRGWLVAHPRPGRPRPANAAQLAARQPAAAVAQSAAAARQSAARQPAARQPAAAAAQPAAATRDRAAGVPESAAPTGATAAVTAAAELAPAGSAAAPAAPGAAPATGTGSPGAAPAGSSAARAVPAAAAVAAAGATASSTAGAAEGAVAGAAASADAAATPEPAGAGIRPAAPAAAGADAVAAPEPAGAGIPPATPAAAGADAGAAPERADAGTPPAAPAAAGADAAATREPAGAGTPPAALAPAAARGGRTGTAPAKSRRGSARAARAAPASGRPAPGVGVISLLGQAGFSRVHLRNPFEVVGGLIERVKQQTPIVLVDFHATVTSEKVAMSLFLDGKVTAMIGTHVRTLSADARLLSGGTAAITHSGRTGSLNSVGGLDPEIEIRKFVNQVHELSGDTWGLLELQGVVLEVGEDGAAHSISILRRQTTAPEAARKAAEASRQRRPARGRRPGGRR